MSSSQDSLRQFTNESEPGVTIRCDETNVLGDASWDGIVTPIPNNIIKEDFKHLKIFVKLTEKNKRSGAGSLTMIVQNDKHPDLEFHSATRYNELKGFAIDIENHKHGKALGLYFPASFCDKTSTLTEKCTMTRTHHIQQYFNNVLKIYERNWLGGEEDDEFLKFLQEKNKWRVFTHQERNETYEGGRKKTRKRNRKRKGGKKTSKRRRKGKRKSRKRKRSLKKRRRGRKRRKKTKRRK